MFGFTAQAATPLATEPKALKYVSIRSSPTPSSSQTVTVTVPNIPAGAIVLAFSTDIGSITLTDDTVTSANLAFTRRIGKVETHGTGMVNIFTAVAGSDLVNEVITLQDTNAAFGYISLSVALVLNGDSTKLTNTTTSQASAVTTAFTQSLVCTGAVSYVFTVLIATSGGAPPSPVITPAADTLLIADNPENVSYGRESSVLVSAAKSTGTVTNSGTLSLSSNWAAASIEIQAVTTSTTFSETLTEASTAADSLVVSFTFSSNLSEAASAADAFASAATFVAPISEAASAVDTLANAEVFAQLVTEPASAADSLVNSGVFNYPLFENSFGADSLAPNLVITKTLTEASAATDALLAATTFAEVIPEAASAADAFTSAATFVHILTEPVTASDSLVPNLVVTVTVNESASAADTLTNSQSFFNQILELGIASDRTPAQGHAVDANTLTLWRLDEPALPWKDVSGNGLHLNTALAGNVFPGTIAGLVADDGYAKGSCRGINVYRSTQYSNAAMLGEVTIEAWIRLDADFTSGGGASIQGIAGHTAATGTTINLRINKTTRLLSVNWTGIGTSQDDTTVLNLGQTYHVAVVRKTSGGQQFARFYVNGVFSSQTGLVGTCTSPASQFFVVGGNLNVGDCLYGAIDDVRISTVARTDPEIASSYARAFPGFDASLVMPASISEAATAADAVANSQTFTQSLLEAVTVGDTLANSQIFNQLLSEAATALDSLFNTLSGSSTTFNESLTESSSAADALTQAQIFAQSLTEAATAASSLVQNAITTNGVTEAAAAADALTNFQTFAQSISETATAADSLTNAQGFAQFLSEASAAATAFVASTVFNAPVSEAASAADSLTNNQVFSQSLTESVTALDSLVNAQKFVQTMLESATAADSLANNQVFAQAVNEAVIPADALSNSQVFNQLFSESVNALTTFVQSQVFANLVSEVVAASDGLTQHQVMNAIITEMVVADVSVLDALVLGAKFKLYFNARLDDDFNSGFG